MKNHVILVNNEDQQTGTMEKLEAHQKALLHRAISVFIMNKNGEWLLQQRAKDKYHSSSLWSNTSCTHPFPGESNLDAAKRRLQEEMGIQCELQKIFDFIYKEPLDNELTEHEFDHVFIGISDELPKLNTNEVMDYKYISYSDLMSDLETNPHSYTVWFKKIVNRVYQYLHEYV